MTDPSALVQPHAAAIVNALVEALASPDGQNRLKAAKLLLLWGWGLAGSQHAAPDDARTAEQQRMLDLLLPHLRSAAKPPDPAATPCPARNVADAAASAQDTPHAETATNPLSPERAAPPEKNTPLAKPELTPCPAATPVAAAPVPPSNPSANPMSCEDLPSPLAAPPGTHPLDTRRRDADPMSRPLLPPRHSGSDFYRRLPTPPPMEPPWPFMPDHWQAHRRRRWS